MNGLPVPSKVTRTRMVSPTKAWFVDSELWMVLQMIQIKRSLSSNPMGKISIAYLYIYKFILLRTW